MIKESATNDQTGERIISGWSTDVLVSAHIAVSQNNPLIDYDIAILVPKTQKAQ
jgi:hypothetical protein